MDAVEQLRRLFQHNAWADEQLISALRHQATGNPAWREYAHLLATEAVWLDRIRQQPVRIAVWPELTPDEVETLRARIAAEYDSFVNNLAGDSLDQPIPYVNTAGRAFVTPLADILLHVALHGQYHRGKVNLLLRQSGADPAPTDFIAFARGAPAAQWLPPTTRP